MHTVAIVAFDAVVPFDLAVPCEVFGLARLADGSPAYRVRVCGVSEVVRTAWFDLSARWNLDDLAFADTIIVPGGTDVAQSPPVLLDALRAAAARGARIASICSGAFVLAEAGLLDGRRATTHWVGAAELARRYPAVQVEPAVLYVDEGQVLTSAGAAAGLDLCLHLVRRDYGAAVAADVARISVMPLERAGGQAQFIARPAPVVASGSLAPLLAWIDDHLHEPLEVPAMARRAAMSARTLARRFQEQTGTSPAQWVSDRRLRRAQELLESSDLAVDEVAVQVGLGASSTLRDHFQRSLGTSPNAYRRAFRRAGGETQAAG